MLLIINIQNTHGLGKVDHGQFQRVHLILIWHITSSKWIVITRFLISLPKATSMSAAKNFLPHFMWQTLIYCSISNTFLKPFVNISLFCAGFSVNVS